MAGVSPIPTLEREQPTAARAATFPLLGSDWNVSDRSRSTLVDQHGLHEGAQADHQGRRAAGVEGRTDCASCSRPESSETAVPFLAIPSIGADVPGGR